MEYLKLSENENLELPNIKEVVELRVELVFRNKCSSEKLNGKLTVPVQGDSVDVYLRVTNKSDKIFHGAKVVDFLFDHKVNEIHTIINKGVQLRTLNAGECYEQRVDWTTFKFDGVYWVSLNLEPMSKNQDILTFQYDPAHKQDEKYEINHWGNTIFLEGKLATLQNRTNNYILLLTAITVWEAVFGIKDTVKVSLSMLSYLLNLIILGIEFLLSLT